MSITLSNASKPSTAACAPGLTRRALHAVGQRLEDHLVDQRALARPRHAGDADELAHRQLDVDALEVVLARAPHAEPAASWIRRSGTGIDRRPRQVGAGDRRASLAITCSAVPSATTRPPCSPGARAHVDDVVGSAHRVLVVLDHDHRVAQLAQPLERRQQPGVVALVQADRRLVEDVQHAHQAGADLGGQPDPLRLAAGEAGRSPVEASGSRRRRSRGSSAARGSPSGCGRRSPLGLGQLQPVARTDRPLDRQPRQLARCCGRRP